MVRSSAEVGKNCSGRGTKEEKYIQVTPQFAVRKM